MADNDKIKDTLNLPQTSFSMKAKLAQKEPEIIKKWDQINLYEKIVEERKEGKPFILHDGPPYANGNIHLGTALNKILKDFIVKSKMMMGYSAPYVPGWDCHGLPIEIKVDQLLGKKKKEMSTLDIRDECGKYALKFVDIQRGQFIRLGVFGDWKNPYLTMNKAYEADVLRYLAAFFSSGNVYKGKRPVHWCPFCQTALAEAEIEYKDRESPSIYVKFPMSSDLPEKFPELKGKKVSILIWTTTPWTLPANLAIAFHPDYEYAAFAVGREVYIAASRLVPVIAEELGISKPEILVKFPGEALRGMKAGHPFIDRESVFVFADYVTLDQGTGCVHTAPGHGYEDYLTGMEYGLEIYTPVDKEGCFTDQVEKYHGINVFEANPLINEDMKKDGTLVKQGTITHSYPHCWRCKRPVIFRATSQWFISMEKSGLREKALDGIKKVRWIPGWGEERIANMVTARPDWCISRQRSWGVPIPAFTCRDCGEVLADASITEAVAAIFEKEGSDAWYNRTADELIPPGSECPGCGSKNFSKENNILDVWFESGASFNVLLRRGNLAWPADIYIEGHDQYRGWFNSSLFIGIGAKKRAPYKTVITHGFVLDEEGRGMSKSLGNFIEPEEIISQNGAEILRLWVAMLNYKEDARFGEETIQRIVEAYRKIRNTWRFILGNIHDFLPDRDAVGIQEMTGLDRWILERLNRIGKRILKAYDEYEYHIVFHTLYSFFTVDLSSFYLDVLKDRLYCSGKTENIRRSAQTVLFTLLRSTLTLTAPLLPFTAEEAWEIMPGFTGKAESVHLELFPSFAASRMEEREFEEWQTLKSIRENVLKELENAREEKLIGNSLEAKVVLKPAADREGLLKKMAEQLPDLFIVSEVELLPASGPDFDIKVVRVEHDKCRRCWKYLDSVGSDDKHPDLCRRCAKVVEDMRS